MISDQYFAGLLDGKGYFGLNLSASRSKTTHEVIRINPSLLIYLGLKATRETQPAMEEIGAEYGGNLVNFECRGYPHVRLTWENSLKIIGVLKRIEPYLIIKKEAARVLMKAALLHRSIVEREPERKTYRYNHRLYSKEDLLKFADLFFYTVSPRQVPRIWTKAKMIEWMNSIETGQNVRINQHRIDMMRL